MERIIQIIPADGWSAVFNDEDTNKASDFMYTPLVCWALVEDEKGFRRVVGIECEKAGWVNGADPLEFADMSMNFTGYAKFRPDGTPYKMPNEDTGPRNDES